MPKLKTRKAAAKRFKATGTGKFMRRRAFHNHLLEHKSPKQKRHLGTKAVVDRTDEERVTLMMPYARAARLPLISEPFGSNSISSPSWLA